MQISTNMLDFHISFTCGPSDMVNGLGNKRLHACLSPGLRPWAEADLKAGGARMRAADLLELSDTLGVKGLEVFIASARNLIIMLPELFKFIMDFLKLSRIASEIFLITT